MRIATALLWVSWLAGCATSTEPSPPAPDAQQLIGRWAVDLRAKPGDPGYFQELVVTSVQGSKFSGSFYGAPIEQARINTDWGAVRIAFVTSDQSGPYHHAATLIDGRLEGLTNSSGRDFLAYWRAGKR